MISRIKRNDAETTDNVYDSSLFEHREVRICMGQLDWRLSTSEVEQGVKNGVALRFATNFQIKILKNPSFIETERMISRIKQIYAEKNEDQYPKIAL